MCDFAPTCKSSFGGSVLSTENEPGEAIRKVAMNGLWNEEVFKKSAYQLDAECLTWGVLAVVVVVAGFWNLFPRRLWY